MELFNPEKEDGGKKCKMVTEVHHESLFVLINGVLLPCSDWSAADA